MPATARRRRGIALLEWAVIGLVALALSVALIVLLSGYFAGRDPAGISSSGAGHGAISGSPGPTPARPAARSPADH